MFGAVQFGVLAACVVLFVPMGMAGWHLSRNKVLFFSGALFITLAVGVHLTPYFPAFSSMLSSSPSLSSLPSSPVVSSVNRDSCIAWLHDIEFQNNIDSNSSVSHTKSSWKWRDSSNRLVDCVFQKLSKSDASDLLNGSWVVVAGDSQARLMVVSLLELLVGLEEIERVREDLFKRHSDYHTTVNSIGMKLDFIWAPYVSNLTNFLVELREKRYFPDVIVMGAGLWDMLHVNNASEYGVSVKMLKDSVMPMLPVTPAFEFEDRPVEVRSPHMFWLGMPTLVNSMLNTEAKREKMTDDMWYAYDEQIYESKLVRKFGGPLFLLDIHSLSGRCGSLCTDDGMHYHGVVYDAAVHVMLNALLFESQQRLT
ncbi:OLC1v1010317C1 [Oldenlandia corymbosa var. corymbosa]|uniref:OLC1v1010317C1 n=1 Tax=Oldenlandia corymbosa var. corymbosa TaxID=529605 RepID=A0AAV1DR20_OLDCO|nr:OLC1v1010317C1 [Oldenlandia corymbosa var. corymbosa]